MNNTSLIKITTLEKEYKILLGQYDSAYKNYINILNKNKGSVESNYQLLKDANGSSNTYCRGEGWNQNGWPKIAGYFPKEQCQALCDEDPYCSGYDLARKDKNGNYDCALFNISNYTPQTSPEAYGCYKKKIFEKPSQITTTITGYGIVGIGTDGKDYFKPSLTEPWQRLPNDTGGDLIACAFNPANNMYFGITKSAGAVYKNSFKDYTFAALVNSCCIIDLAVSYDGQYGVVVDTANQLWSGTMTTFMNQTGFTPAVNPNQSEYCRAVAISPQGQVFVVGSDNFLYMKDSYLTLKTTLWRQVPSSCCLISLSFAPDGTMIGVGTDKQLYTKSPNNGYTENWTLIPSSCCVISIATIKTSKTTTTTNIPKQFQSSNNNLNEFLELQGQNYWGTAPLNQGTVDSLEQCETMCASDMNCTGATFQSDRNYCYTRTGQGNIIPGKPTDYALIPEKRQALLNLQMLNNKLLNIIQQINIEFTKIKPEVNQEQIEKNAKKMILNNNYAALLNEQQIITDNLNDYVNLEIENENHSLMTNQKNILLKFWSFFALILLAITFKFVFKVEGSSLIFLIITFLMIVIFLSLNWWSLIPVLFLPLLIKMIYFS